MSIDRQSPKQRPSGPRAAFHRWQKLTFIHWEVPVEALRPLVPAELTLDTFEGRAFIGLVPFTMRDIRLRFLPPWPGMIDFHETNVRTYVHDEQGVPGVWFFSLDAASRTCVVGARATYHLPYHFARMDLRSTDNTISYESERLWPGPRPAHSLVVTRIGEALGHAATGSLEDFLCERYVLYAKRGDRLFRGSVHHTPYPLQEAKLDRLEDSLVSATGIDVEATSPVSVLYSPGVDVDVFSISEVSRS